MAKPTVIDTFDYRDETGKVIYRQVRTEPGPEGEAKSFHVERPDARGGWTKGRGGIELIPYRLDELLKAKGDGRTVFVPEGEKKADLLVSVGLLATANPNGANGY